MLVKAPYNFPSRLSMDTEPAEADAFLGAYDFSITEAPLFEIPAIASDTNHSDATQDYRRQLQEEHRRNQEAAVLEANRPTPEIQAPFVGAMVLLAAATRVSPKEQNARLAEHRRRANYPFLSSEVRRAARNAIPRHLR